MSYKILIILAIAAILSLSIYSNAFAINENLTNQSNSLALDSDNINNSTKNKAAEIVIQNTSMSKPSPAKHGQPIHETVYALPLRDDGKVYVGTATFTASKPIEVEILHVYAPTPKPDSRHGEPYHTAFPENKTLAITHLEKTVVDTLPLGVNGTEISFGSFNFAGSSLLFHNIKGEPFTVTYTIDAKVKDASTDINNISTNINQSDNTTNPKNIQNNILIAKLLAKNLENHLQKAGAILNITSKLPQIREVPISPLLNQTLKAFPGIPQGADIEKRQIAKNIISSNSNFYEVFLILPNGDGYLLEPYPIQQSHTTANFAFRDYFQGALRTHDLYLGNVITSASTSLKPEAVIAIPVYSLKDNSTIVGVLGGGIDLNILSKELQSLNITQAGNDNTRVVYLDNAGHKAADSDKDKSKIPESFTRLTSFKNAMNGQSGSVIDTVDNTKMLVTYQPAKVFHNTWVVLLMQPLQQR